MSYTEDFRSQSSRWGWARVNFEVEEVGPSTTSVAGVRLFKRYSGDLVEFTIVPGGEWHGQKIRWSGYVTVKSQPAELALGNRGNWSGGSNYSGWVFLKPGGCVELSCKGTYQYLVFANGNIEWTNFPPDAKPAEEV